MKPLDPAARPSHPEFDVHLTENVLVRMRDGVRLAADDASLRLHTATLLGRVRDRLDSSVDLSRLPARPGRYVQA